MAEPRRFAVADPQAQQQQADEVIGQQLNAIVRDGFTALGEGAVFAAWPLVETAIATAFWNRAGRHALGSKRTLRYREAYALRFCLGALGAAVGTGAFQGGDRLRHFHQAMQRVDNGRRAFKIIRQIASASDAPAEVDPA